jgi:hypothetical protein
VFGCADHSVSARVLRARIARSAPAASEAQLVGGHCADGVQIGSVLRGYVQQFAYVVGHRVHGHVVQPTAT